MRSSPYRQSPGFIVRAPYPLPKKREKQRSGILRAPKRIYLRHRKFVRGRQCCVPGCTTPHVVDVAHLRSVAEGSGTSLKPFDWFTVPLCRHHHIEEEACGPDAFGDRHGIDLWAIAAELVRKSPDTAMRLAHLEWQADQEAPKPLPVTVSIPPPASSPPRMALIPFKGRVS